MLVDSTRVTLVHTWIMMPKTIMGSTSSAPLVFGEFPSAVPFVSSSFLDFARLLFCVHYLRAAVCRFCDIHRFYKSFRAYYTDKCRMCSHCHTVSTLSGIAIEFSTFIHALPSLQTPRICCKSCINCSSYNFCQRYFLSFIIASFTEYAIPKILHLATCHCLFGHICRSSLTASRTFLQGHYLLHVSYASRAIESGSLRWALHGSDCGQPG